MTRVRAYAMLKLAMLALTACGPRQWTRTDTTLQAAATLTMVADYGQTIAIARNSFETNPIMGPSGERVPVHVYFPTVIAGHAVAMMYLPPKVRRVAQLVTLGVEAITVEKNRRLGYTWSYCF